MSRALGGKENRIKKFRKGVYICKIKMLASTFLWLSLRPCHVNLIEGGALLFGVVNEGKKQNEMRGD